jgi:hypothetical protein
MKTFVLFFFLFFTPQSFAALTCPAGFTYVEATTSEQPFCISSKSQSALDWRRANSACSKIDSHLCSENLWYRACNSNQIVNMPQERNWVSDLVPESFACGLGGYNGRCAYTLGGNSCNTVSSGQITYDVEEISYRCCMN